MSERVIGYNWRRIDGDHVSGIRAIASISGRDYRESDSTWGIEDAEDSLRRDVVGGTVLIKSIDTVWIRCHRSPGVCWICHGAGKIHLSGGISRTDLLGRSGEGGIRNRVDGNLEGSGIPFASVGGGYYFVDHHAIGGAGVG